MAVIQSSRIDLDVGRFEQLMGALPVTSHRMNIMNIFLSLPGEISPFSHQLWRNEASPDKTVPQ